MGAKDLGIDSKVFFGGKVYVIAAQYDARTWVLSDYEQLSLGEVVPKDRVEPLVVDTFRIGDRVQTSYWFRGTVTGYELDTNRAICVSDAVNRNAAKSRERWAYKIDEIRLIPHIEIIELNRLYRVRIKYSKEEFTVRAMEDPNYGSTVHLYRTDNGRLFSTVVKEYKSAKEALQQWEIIAEEDADGCPEQDHSYADLVGPEDIF